MKSIFKKIFSVALSLVIMVEMAMPVVADDNIPVIDMGTFHNVYSAGDGTFTLSDWDNYITNFNGDEYLVLEKYNGTETEITIKGKVKKNGKEYQVLLEDCYDTEDHGYHSLFEDNGYIEKVTFVSVDGTAVGVYGSMGANSLFKGCTALKEVNFNDSLVRSGTDKLHSINGMFEGCTVLQKADLSGLDLSECEEAKEVFKGCTGVTEMCLDGDDFRKTYTVSGMFEGCTALEAADLTTATWGDIAKYVSRMFAGDTKLSEITVPSDFAPDVICQEMFQVDKPTKLTIKGNPSDDFQSTLFPLMKDNNRYIGEISLEAHVDLDGADLEDEMFSFTLYNGGIADDTEIATAKNDADGKISFGTVKVYDITEKLEFVATMSEADNVTCETESLCKDITLELNEDGTLSVKD